MKRIYWILALISVLLWFLFKDVAYRSIVAGYDEPASVQLSYLGEEGWALLPVEPPPGAWLDPWGIDLFIIPSPTSATTGRGLVGAANEKVSAEIRVQSHQIEKVLAPAGPSYSPIYRHPSASTKANDEHWATARDDLAMAFERYLFEKNNWRGVLIVGAPESEPLISPLLERVESDPRLLERFSGVVLLGAGPSAIGRPVNCSIAFEDDCIIQGDVKRQRSFLRSILPNLRRAPAKFEFEDGEDLSAKLTQRNTRLSIWLDKNAPKPAEPLGGLEDMEVIEIAPVRRPGETDDAIAERELRSD